MLIRDLFIEICKRGCYIETKYKYDTSQYLPECMVVYNDHFVDENSDENERYEHQLFNFKIKCLNGSPLYVGITKTRGYASKDFNYTANYISKRCSFIASEFKYFINFEELDCITHFLYMDADVPYYWDSIYAKQTIIPRNIMNTYKLYLKGQMVKYLNKYLQIFYAMFLFSEIKNIIIMNIIMIDKWNYIGYPVFQ